MDQFKLFFNVLLQFQIKKDYQCNFYFFLFIIRTSPCLVRDHGYGPRPGPGLSPSPGPWTRSRSRHISGPGHSIGPGPVIFLVPALVPVRSKFMVPSHSGLRIDAVKKKHRMRMISCYFSFEKL